MGGRGTAKAHSRRGTDGQWGGGDSGWTMSGGHLVRSQLSLCLLGEGAGFRSAVWDLRSSPFPSLFPVTPFLLSLFPALLPSIPTAILTTWFDLGRHGTLYSGGEAAKGLA